MIALVGLAAVGVALAMIIYLVASTTDPSAHLAAPPLPSPGPTQEAGQGAGTPTGPGTDNRLPAYAPPGSSRYGGVGTAGPAPVTATGSAGTVKPFVTLAQAAAPLVVDLTGDGPVDWMHFGRTGADPSADDRKSTGSGAIADEVDGPRNSFGAFPVRFGWSDGTPTPRMSGTATGLYACVGSALTVTITPGPGTQVVKVYAGLLQARGQLSATLSGAGPTATTSVENRTGDTMVQFTVTFRAPPGTRLTLRWAAVASFVPGDQPFCGNVALQAVTVAHGP